MIKLLELLESITEAIRYRRRNKLYPAHFSLSYLIIEEDTNSIIMHLQDDSVTVKYRLTLERIDDD